MSRLVNRCPSCEGQLQATRLSCPACAVQLEGQFELPLLLQLQPEDITWVIEFVRTSGSLKEMAKRTGVSYPTVRNRLDDILKQHDGLTKAAERKRHEIHDALEKGKLSEKAAAEKLRKGGP